jgi:acetylornithine deacetylase/succinyl-diaminopimelate desuccinylase-like protein
MKNILLTAFICCALNISSNELDPIDLLKEFVAVDTINPPGNEINAVRFYAEIFDQYGISYQVAESAPGRGNIWARIEGGDQPALMLLQHTDVVPADKEYWETDPMLGTIKDGYLYGRGVIDMKGLGIAHLVAFLSAYKNQEKLTRDIVFLATADEEAGGFFGAGWMLENYPEAFDGVKLLLNEGGSGTTYGDKEIFSVEVTQKVPVWLRLKSEGSPGHGSSPQTVSAVTQLIEALNNLYKNPFPARIIQPVDTYFRSLAEDMSASEKDTFMDMAAAIQSDKFLRDLQDSSPSWHALTRDTCSITMLEGSSKINVVPPVAFAEVDCRMLPDRTVAEFIQDFNERVAPFNIQTELIMAFGPAVSSTTSELFQAIEKVTKKEYPNSRVIPAVSTGFTDSHFTREIGIESYGFNPMLFESGEFRGVHGNNERVKIEAYNRSIKDLQLIIEEVAYKD